jgi:hypothetical protein
VPLCPLDRQAGIPTPAYRTTVPTVRKKRIRAARFADAKSHLVLEDPHTLQLHVSSTPVWEAAR